jgi:hypothetical protein
MILDSGPSGYYVLELEAQVATLICLVVFLLAILGKFLNSMLLFFPLEGWCVWLFKVVAIV